MSDKKSAVDPETPRDAANEADIDATPESSDRPADAGAHAGSGDGARAERDEYLDRLRRLQAEFENYQKRIQREKADWNDRTLESFVTDLLPILDNFERAIESSRESDGESGFFQGVEMIHGELLKYLEGRGVSAIDVVGSRFDPAFCEAVLQVDSADHPDKTVLQEFRRGYELKGRVLRPAQVQISRRPAGDDDASSSAQED